MASITEIPYVILAEILARLIATSFPDFFNAKMSCKDLLYASDDDIVYRNAPVSKFPIVSWPPIPIEVKRFLERCKISGNAEIIFRDGLVATFIQLNLNHGVDLLRQSAHQGFLGALYVQGIVQLYQGDESKAKGIKIISYLRKSKLYENELNSYNDSLHDLVKSLWENNDYLFYKKPICCNIDGHYQDKAWDLYARYTDQECDACICDLELCSLF